MQFPRKPRRSPSLNIIPLIDVLVVLLIFYIATTVFKKSEPKINIVVPKTTQATTTKETPPSIIFVAPDSKLYLNDALVEPEQLTETLKSKMASDPTFKLAMKADTNAPFGAIIKVMDAARAAGINDLQTFMKPEKENSGGAAQ